MKRTILNPNNPEDKAKIDFSNVDILDFNLVTNPNGHLKELCYLVKCRDCGKQWYKPKRSFGKQKCKCNASLNGLKNRADYKNISAGYYRTIKYGAKARGIGFNLTKEDFWNQWVKQDGKCALCGVDLVFQKSHKDLKYMTASLDRIDSNGDYTVDNIQWVLKDLNKIKFTFSQDYFIDMCRMIVNYQDKKNKV